MSNHPSMALIHHTIITFIIERGYGPNVAELAAQLHTSGEAVEHALHALQEYHGVVLHPNNFNIWVIHPFSLAPTNFLVRTSQQAWWSNCAWCALGAAALVGGDVTITTTLGADDQQVEVQIKDGRVVETGYWVHFPIPMRHAWDNVIYTCSTMLLFESEQQIDGWCRRHRIPKGDVQPIATVWEFARVWYGNHLSPTWRKWTAEEAQHLFAQFGLTGPIWQLPASSERF